MTDPETKAEPRVAAVGSTPARGLCQRAQQAQISPPMDGVRFSLPLVWVCGFDPRRWNGWHPTATEMPDDNSKTRCQNCGYEWPYRGDMPAGSNVTCPACQQKTEYVPGSKQ